MFLFRLCVWLRSYCTYVYSGNLSLRVDQPDGDTEDIKTVVRSRTLSRGSESG